ncbi:hypothetical protein [Methylocystis parvus]|uniref:hypothetical protein n=1 Tax=Methylocystis parvus TaxID=134 RepID=UPI003C727C4B
MRLALVCDGVVVNVIEASGDFIPDGDVKAVPSTEAGPGWRYDGHSFLQPNQSPRPPDVVSMFQAREALRRSPSPNDRNLLDAVDAYVATRRLDQPTLALAWEYATEVERSGAFVHALAEVFGLDDAALDSLFLLAATISA